MKIKDVIFCDDIRKEVNNKFSLMGLYNDKIVIKSHPGVKIQWPVNLHFATLIRLELDKNDRFDRFEYKYINNEIEIVKFEGKASKKEFQSFFNINVVSQIPLNIGNFGFHLTVYDGEKVVFDEVQNHAIKVSQEDISPGQPLFA